MHITLKHKTPNIKQMYYILVILAVFSAACAQMLLKQGARQEYAHWWRQYLNIWVISGYFILFGSLGIAMYGQREIAYLQDNTYSRSKTFFEIVLMRCITIGISLMVFYFIFLRDNEYSIYYKILVII